MKISQNIIAAPASDGYNMVFVRHPLVSYSNELPGLNQDGLWNARSGSFAMGLDASYSRYWAKASVGNATSHYMFSHYGIGDAR